MTPTHKKLLFWTIETFLAIFILSLLIGQPIADFLNAIIFQGNETARLLFQTPLVIFICGSINAIAVGIGQKIIERKKNERRN